MLVGALEYLPPGQYEAGMGMDRDKVEIWLPALMSHYMQLDKRKPSSIQSILVGSL